MAGRSPCALSRVPRLGGLAGARARQHVFRAVDVLGIGPKHPVIFECVGAPGVLDEVIASAPLFSRVIGVGVSMGADRIRPSMAINKEIDLRFVVGYTPLEFRDTLHMLADGKLDAGPLLTGTVGLGRSRGRVRSALAKPEKHAKILIDPKSQAAEPGAADHAVTTRATHTSERGVSNGTNRS